MNKELNKEEMEEFFGKKFPKRLSDGSEYPLFLLVFGARRGAVTMNATGEEIRLLKEFSDIFDLEHLVSSGRKSKPERKVMNKKERNQKAVFISRDGERFEMLEEGRFYGFSDDSVGRFLGFPDDSIKFFLNNDQPAMKSRKKISEMNRREKFGEDLKFLNLVTYVPAPEPEEVEKGIEKGKKNGEVLRKFDRRENSELGRKMINQRLSRNLYR